jgi:hypothetical protein
MFIKQWVELDMFLLDTCFQRFSDYVQEHTERSCFWLSKWAIRFMFASIVGGIIWIARDVYADPTRAPLLVSMTAIAFLMEPVRLFRMSVFLDENEETLVGEIETFHAGNPYRFIFAGRRFSGVMYSLLTWPLIGFSVMLLREAIPLAVSLQLLLSLYTVATYFMSCTPKPRGREPQKVIALSGA